MLRKIFTSEQLSSFFQIAVFINIISLFLDLVIYHYFATNIILKLISENLNHLGIFIIGLIIISQALLIFANNHKKLISQYKITALTILICIGIVLAWFLTIENDIEDKFIIFYSSISQFNHSYRIKIILLTIFMLLILDFYRNIKNPMIITDTSVRNVIRSSFKIVLRKHLLMLIFISGIVHFEKIHKFSIELLHYSESSLVFDLNIIETLIPITWISGIVYYIYQYLHQNENHA